MTPREQAIAIYDNAIAGCSGSVEDTQALQRHLATTDLFFLLVYILGRKDVNRDWLFDRCREIELAPNGYLDLWAREHYKSTLITFGLSIKDILADPEITIGIFSYSRPIAKAFLRQIKIEFETNELLRSLFPEIIWENPHRESPKWSEDDGLIVKRKSNPKESTVEAWGLVDSQPTSKHYKLMIYDDAVTQESVGTPEMIAKVTERWEGSRNLTSEGGVTRYIGTRWHHADTYREILDRGAAVERRYAVTKEGTADGEPWLWTRRRVAEKYSEMGRRTFAAQMLQDPTAGGARDFDADWLRYYDPRDSAQGMNVYLVADPANAKKKVSDYSAFVVIGLATDNNMYVLDIVRDRLSLTERGDCLFALHRRWRPMRVGYERYGMQADIEYFHDRMRLENYRFEVIELAGTLSKADRIRRLIPICEAGRFWLPHYLEKMDYEGKMVELIRQFVDHEYLAFPVAAHDDVFDAMSRIMDPDIGPLVWPRPALPEPERDRYARRKPAKRGYSSWAA